MEKLLLLLKLLRSFGQGQVDRKELVLEIPRLLVSWCQW